MTQEYIETWLMVYIKRGILKRNKKKALESINKEILDLEKKLVLPAIDFSTTDFERAI